MKDADIIRQLGGPTAVARLLNLPVNGGAQRVHNWLARGIPAAVKVSRPDLFMPDLVDGSHRPSAKAEAA